MNQNSSGTSKFIGRGLVIATLVTMAAGMVALPSAAANQKNLPNSVSYNKLLIGQDEAVRQGVVGTLILLSILKKEKERKELHYTWCENRYRSYVRKSDTFQPFTGDRRKCVSPHSKKSGKK